MEISVKTIGETLTEAIDRVSSAGERVVLTRKRKGVAALVSMDDLAALQRLEDQADVRASRKARKEKGGITLDEFKRRLEDEADLQAALRAKAEMKRKGEKPIPLAEVKRRLGMK